MVRCKSTSRLSSIILTQTDTTVGFLSLDADALYEIKERSTKKQFIKVYTNFKALLSTCRVPNNQKNIIRRAKKTTFIVKNNAFRIAENRLNSQVLRNSTCRYSTSANKSNEKFSREFCEDKADIIIENIDGLKENSSSKLIKLNNKKRKRLR